MNSSSDRMRTDKVRRWQPEVLDGRRDVPAPPPPPEAHHYPTVAELEDIRQSAQREGYAAGYEEGTARVRLEAMHLHAAQEQLEQSLSRLDRELGDELVALTLAIAAGVVREAVRVQPESLLTLIREALAQLPQQHTVIHLHPDDVALVRQHAGDELTHAGHRLREDPGMERGGCRLEAGASTLDASLETRWRRVVEGLGSHIEWNEYKS
ncbi:MAG: hypothetical protein IOMNBAOH_02162 [Rhodocyclaceae bacterium]|nr:hypothetical protein [Rhodocyclaceae bacterium]